MKKLFLTLMLTLAATIGAGAQTFSGNLVSDEGAWCWFADPRAMHYENAAGTINATYLGYIDVHGNVKATQYDWTTGRKADVLIRSYFQPDDHNNPTFVVLPDERVMIFYTRHTDEACIWYRISRRPGDITSLGDEKRLATANNTTYPSPFILSDDPNHIYLCWRGINWHPTIARLTMPDADDNCSFDFGPKQIVQSTGARPYAKYQSNGKDKIYLAYTTGHPDNEQPNWLYFNVVDINHGNGPILRDIKGNQLSVIANGVHNVNKQTSYATAHPAAVVDNTANIRNWVWQITLDAQENPVIAFTHIDDAKTSHVYWYGRWTGTEWRRTWVQYAGHAFHQNWNQTERCYTGGMAVDPDNVNDLYLSIPTTNGAYNKDGVYEIWRYTINDDGTVGTSEQLTRGSAKNNVRPFILPGSKQSPMRLVWMNGDYYYWMVQKNYPKGYPTGIRADYEWPETATGQTVPDEVPTCTCLFAGQTFSMAFAMDQTNYTGTLFNWECSGEEATYYIDADMYPVFKVGNRTYRSQNRLLTSDDWATGSTGTSGDNHPTKLTTWVLTMTYDGQRLTLYRNGLIDQVIEETGLGGTLYFYDPQTAEDYSSRVIDKDIFYACASPLTVGQIVGEVEGRVQARLGDNALQMLSLPAETRTDLVLPATSLGQTVTWTSSDATVLTADGIVSFPEADTDVTLTAACGTATRQFTVTVHPRDVNANLQTTLDGPLDLTANTATGFDTNTYATLDEGLLKGLRSYTVLVNINATRLSGSPRIYDFGSASGNSLFLRANPLSAGIKYNGGTTTMVSSTTQLSAATDYALAVTFDAASKTTRIYIDGQEAASGTANQNEPYMLAELAADTRNYVGRTQWWDTSYKNDNQDFCGTISKLKVYDVCLTREEICKRQGLDYEEVELPADIVNGDFEGAYSVQAGSGVSADRAIYVPEGWKVERTSPNENDLTALRAGDLYYSNFFAALAKPADGGEQTYWIRQNWGTPTQTLSQTVRLPEGRYTLTVALWKSGLGGDAYVTLQPEGGALQKSASLENKEAWQEVKMDFEADGTTPVTISLVAQHTSNGSAKIIGFDNVRLTKEGGEEPGPTPGPDPEPQPATLTEWTFRLKNTTGLQRTDETVEVTVPAGLDLSACTLEDAQGSIVPFEVTADGRARFQATVAAAATAPYKFVPGTATAPDKLTYAAVKMPSSRADIAWENDLNAYRMYSSTLLSSEPNTAQGIDVWYKKQSTPVIDAMYGLSNYHNESQYGVDAYSVNGKRLGCGATAAVVGGKLQMHDPYTTCTVSENGQLGSSFTLTYANVSIGGSSYTKTLNVETLAGSLLNRATMRLDGPQQTVRLAVAIYEHTDMTSITPNGVDFTDVEGIIGRAEDKSEGSLTSAGARFYQGAYVPTQPATGGVAPQTEVIDDHLCLVFDYTPGTELTFYFGGGWSIFPADRYTSDADWFSALEQFKQTADAPLTATSFETLPLKDDVMHILNSVNQTWQQRNATHGDHFWNRAVYHIGNMEAYAVTHDQQYLDFSTAWAVRNNWKGATGTDKSKWKYTYGETADYVLFGDNQVCFQVYADLYNLDPAHDATKIARAREVMEYEMSTSYEGYLWWVDGLFMVMPVMTKLYNITGNELYLDKMYTYWRWYTDRMYDTDEDLYYRDADYVYPAHKTLAGKKDFWARGDGWIFAAFARVLQELPATDSHRDEYISYYRRMAAALKACQQPAGYWERSLLDPDQANGYETSGTALFAYGYAWGIRAGILDEVEYGHTLELAWQYLADVAYQQDGTVGYIQPIGSAAIPGQVVGPTDYHDFGVGAYLMAAAEMSHLAAGDMDKPKLRLATVALGEANEIVVTFNAEPDAAEAANPANYTVVPSVATLSQLTPQGITVNGRTATLTYAEPIDYGRYTVTVSGIHSAAGGEMATGQTRILLRTVPLTPTQDGVTVTAIGAQSGNPAANAIDNNLDTRWSQQGASGQWLQLDLGSAKVVEAVDIAVYNGTSRRNYFDIQTSTDGTTFTPVLTGQESSGMTNELERYRLPEAVAARYVRIVCNGTSAGDWNSITEVRVRVRDTSLDLVTLPAETFSDMVLPAATADGNTIVWTSSDSSVLSGNGAATPGTDDQTVTLTATVGTESRNFDVIVRARSLADNLRLAYAFDDGDVFTEGSQSYIADHSGNGRHGRLMGAGSTVHDGVLDLTSNGSDFAQNGYVLAPAGLLDSLRSYTIVVVATPSNLNKQPRLYDFGSASANSIFLRASTLAAGLKYNGGTTALQDATTALTTGERQEIAVTYDARTRVTTVIVNGQQAATGTTIQREAYELLGIAADTRNYVGRTQWWNTSSKADNLDFCGTYDEVRVYSIVLTDDELSTLFNKIATGIDVATTPAARRHDLYDLSGRRIDAARQHGVYILGGRKVVK